MCRVLPIDQSEITLFDPVSAKALRSRLWSGISQKNEKPGDLTRSEQCSPQERMREVYSRLMSNYGGDEPVSLYRLHYSSDPDDQKVVGANMGKPRRANSMEIIYGCAQKHGISFAELTGPTKTVPFVNARREAAYLLHKQRPDLSLPAIGRLLKRDHTSILYSIRRYAELNGLEASK